ncbi:MAG TPA: GNAT family N-acetyltransferase [Noviherbaspirillum sp.]|nr:GNAT family N-acetyltransferase [Noviherbaspirillum sp.]
MITTETAAGNIAALDRSNARTAASGALTAECFEHAVPPFVEEALEGLYGNLFSTLAHQRVYGKSRSLSTFVLRDGTQLRTVWLYERRGRTVRVLNEGIEVHAHEVARFAELVFAPGSAAGAITFHAIQPRVQGLALPWRRYNCLEDMVLELPPTSTEYLAQLGKSTRSYIHRYMNKLRRDFPSVRFELVEAHEIDEGKIRRIIELNRARMSHKGKVSINDDTLAEQITHLAMDCGMIGALTIEGQVVAGTINYRVADNYFLEVIAHDPRYNAYRLGTLCCYLTVCECIARGGREYHFLWGQDEYKKRLLGKRRDLDDLTVYRSRLHMVSHADLALRQAADGWKRRAQLRIRTLRQGDGPAARTFDALLRRIREMKSGG